MSYEIIKGDITIRADSEQEAENAYRWLSATGPRPVESSKPFGVTPIPLTKEQADRRDLEQAAYDGYTKPVSPTPTGELVASLQAIPAENVAKVVQLNPPEPPMIPVRRMLKDVVEIVLLFPEGISSRGISELAGVTQSKIGHRLTRLKKMGLVELVPGHHDWRATQLARRAKLIPS